jgi:hypothetical protein
MKHQNIIIAAVLILTIPAFGMGQFNKTQKSPDSMTALPQKTALLNAVKVSEYKKIISPNTKDAATKKYYEWNKARADRSFPGKFEVYEVTRTSGKVSLDTQYVAIIKKVFLSPRVDGAIMEDHTDAQYDLPLYDELSFWNLNMKMLWKKTFTWDAGTTSGASIEKVAKNGKSIVVALPNPLMLDEWNATELVVFNKAGQQVISILDDSYPAWEMTDNGRFLYVGKSLAGNKAKWTIYDLGNRDSAIVIQNKEKDSSPFVYEDGRIFVESIGYKKTWYNFDSLKNQKVGNQK